MLTTLSTGPRRIVLDQTGERPQRVGLLFAVFVPVIDALNAADDVTKHALGNIGPDASRLISERAVLRRSCRTHGRLRESDELGIEGSLGFRVAADMGIAATGEHEWIAVEPRLSLDDRERHLGQHELASVSLLADFGRDCPSAVDRHVLPFHARQPCRGAGLSAEHPDECAEGAIRLCRLPHGAQLVVIRACGRAHARSEFDRRIPFTTGVDTYRAAWRTSCRTC